MRFRGPASEFSMQAARSKYRALKKTGQVVDLSFRAWARKAYDGAPAEGKLAQIAGQGVRDGGKQKKQRSA